MTPERNKLKTYAQWIRAGRAVRQGQRAEWYLVTEARDHGVAVFHEDQTEELREPDLAGHTLILSRDEWKPSAPKAPRIRVRRWKEDGLACWAGANEDAIKILKKAGWRFNLGENRWVHADRDLERFVAAMRNKGFDVVVDTPEAI